MPERVDRLEATGGHQPRSRVSRNSCVRPVLHRRSKCIMHRLLGQIEIAEETDERRENAARIGAIDRINPFTNIGCHAALHDTKTTGWLRLSRIS
jgi:hypothetical protein